MNGPDKVRQTLAMQDAGYDARFHYRDVAALLNAYDKATKEIDRLRAEVKAHEAKQEKYAESIVKVVEAVCDYVAPRPWEARAASERDMEAGR